MTRLEYDGNIGLTHVFLCTSRSFSHELSSTPSGGTELGQTDVQYRSLAPGDATRDSRGYVSLPRPLPSAPSLNPPYRYPTQVPMYAAVFGVPGGPTLGARRVGAMHEPHARTCCTVQPLHSGANTPVRGETVAVER